MVAKDKVEQELIGLFVKCSGKEVSLDTEIAEMEMDSLEFVKLIMEIEDLFEVEIDDDTLYVSKGVTVRNFYDFLLDK